MTTDRRAILLKDYTKKSSLNGGGYIHFEKVPLKKLQELFKLGLLDKTDQQNDAPTAGEFMAIMKKNSGLTAHGYIITTERDDDRISIEGVEGLVTADELPNLLSTLRYADSFDIDVEHWRADTKENVKLVWAYQIYCWYD